MSSKTLNCPTLCFFSAQLEQCYSQEIVDMQHEYMLLKIDQKKQMAKTVWGLFTSATEVARYNCSLAERRNWLFELPPVLMTGFTIWSQLHFEWSPLPTFK